MWYHFKTWTLSISSIASNSWWQNIFLLGLWRFERISPCYCKGQLKNQYQIQIFSNDHDKIKCWDLAFYTMTSFCTYLMALLGSKFFNFKYDVLPTHHFKFNKTTKLISQDYSWPHFWNYMKRFITSYDICAWTKNSLLLHSWIASTITNP